MRYYLAVLLLVFSSSILAQTPPAPPTGPQVSPNLIYSTANPYRGPEGSTSPGTWSGFEVTTSTGGGAGPNAGGRIPGYNVETGTFMFGYSQNTINYEYAVSLALRNSGMTWTGYNYSWEYKNQDTTRGTLSANVEFHDNAGAALYSKNYSMGPTTNGWTTYSGTETFNGSGLNINSISNFTLSFTGRDDRFWAGYYGPVLRNPSLTINYTFDACSSNPLSSPSCAGYEAAYQTQQCNINPLYSPACPGYQTAYHNQQCSVDPLSSIDCPGYQTAYHNQQCTLNSSYSTDCPGYVDEQAKLNAECKKNSLYDRRCEGYATAYAIANLVPLDPAVNTAVNQSLSATAAADPARQATQAIKDDTVNAVVTPTQTTSTSSVTSVTSVVREPNPETRTPPKEEKKVEKSSNPETREAPKEEKKEVQSPKKTAETKRRAEEAAKAASKATTHNEVVATQSAIVVGMGILPGFETYQTQNILDAQFYKSKDIYSNQKTVDNRNAQRFLNGASDARHQMMVEQQYQLGEK
jgi:hypothetical protein